MGCSSSCVIIRSQNKTSIFPSAINKKQNGEANFTKFTIPAIRIVRPSVEIRISVTKNRDENLLWEHWQPNESRLNPQHRCSIPNCSVNHHVNDFEKHPEEEYFSIGFWSKKLTFIDKHRKLSKEIRTWDFLSETESHRMEESNDGM
jgi:hypothetical protein